MPFLKSVTVLREQITDGRRIVWHGHQYGHGRLADDFTEPGGKQYSVCAVMNVIVIVILRPLSGTFPLSMIDTLYDEF